MNNSGSWSTGWKTRLSAAVSCGLALSLRCLRLCGMHSHSKGAETAEWFRGASAAGFRSRCELESF
jgi:hypothetical protein